MASPLENLSGPGKPLQKEPPDAEEFAGLKRSGLARLSDAANAANTLEGRFDLAYNQTRYPEAVCGSEVNMAGSGEHKIVQVRILACPQEIGWRNASRRC